MDYKYNYLNFSNTYDFYLNLRRFLIPLIILISSIFHASYAQTTTFAVIGDFGSDNGNEQDVANLVDSWNPSYVITVGDNSYNGNYSDDIGQYYHQYIYPNDPNWGTSGDPSTNLFWPAVGNHDWDYSNLSKYKNYFTLPHNERYYTKQIGNVEFFFIDSDTRENDGTSATSTQGNWIHQQIQNSNAAWKIVIFHHPAYCSGGSNSYMRWPFEDWGVDAVISGHVHVYERIFRDDNGDNKNLVYFVDGLGGKSRGSFGSTVSGSQFRYKADYGAMKVTESSSTIQFQFYSVDGQLQDSYTIDPPNPVQLTSFDAQFNGTNVNLNWNTATEIKNYGFDIERSVDNSSWNKIGFVQGNGSSNVPHNYNFVDKDLTLSRTYYYRLKQIDNDGTFEYSKVAQTEVTFPGKFVLKQNYPNPFNPETNIQYQIPQSSFVQLKVYNELGMEIKTLVNEYKSSGIYEIKFDASKLPSGIYIYRLIAGSFNTVKKMLLMK